MHPITRSVNRVVASLTESRDEAKILNSSLLYSFSAWISSNARMHKKGPVSCLSEVSVSCEQSRIDRSQASKNWGLRGEEAQVSQLWEDGATFETGTLYCNLSLVKQAAAGETSVQILADLDISHGGDGFTSLL